MAACFLNGNSALCRQGIQSFVNGSEHFRRFLRRLVQPMTERLLFPRIEPKDGVLDFRKLGHREKDSDAASPDNWNLGFANGRYAGIFQEARRGVPQGIEPRAGSPPFH
jgi:hypothetical protein